MATRRANQWDRWSLAALKGKTRILPSGTRQRQFTRLARSGHERERSFAGAHSRRFARGCFVPRARAPNIPVHPVVDSTALHGRTIREQGKKDIEMPSNRGSPA